MKAARAMASWEVPQGIAAPRRKRRPAAPQPAAPTVAPRTTAVYSQPERNVHARVIAAVITGLALLIISLAGVRMLGPEERPPEQSAVLAPSEVTVLDQADELDRERVRSRRLREKIEGLVAENQTSSVQLKVRDERLHAQEDALRDRSDALRKAQQEREAIAGQLRATQTQLEEKDRLLRDKEDALRESEARLKSYETAKREAEQRIRELENQLKKANSRPVQAAVADDDWPVLLRNNTNLGSQVRELKKLLQVLDKEQDAEVWALTMREATEIMDGLSGRLRNYPITDAAANEAKSFLSDTLPTRLYALKKQKR